MKEFVSLVKGQVVWVPRAVMMHGASKRKPGEKYLECEVVENSGVSSPSVKLSRTDLVDNDQWVNKQVLQTVRP